MIRMRPDGTFEFDTVDEALAFQAKRSAEIAGPSAAAAAVDAKQQYVARPAGRRKRPHGAGSVFHRGGLWSIRWLDETGVRRFLSGIETEERAEQALDEMIAKRTDALLRLPLTISQKRSEAGRRNVSKRWGKLPLPIADKPEVVHQAPSAGPTGTKELASPADPEGAPGRVEAAGGVGEDVHRAAAPVADAEAHAPIVAPARPKGQKRCKVCDKPGHFAKTCPDASLPVHPAPAGEEVVDDRSEIAPPLGAETEDAAFEAAAEDERWGGFSGRAGVRENTDITSSSHATRTKRGILASLIRRDDPPERPVIVDVGGVEVVALEVGPTTKVATRVRWQSGPGAWGSEVAEVNRLAVIRDATDAEVQQDLSESSEDLDVDEAASAG